MSDTYTWHGKICGECGAAFRASPTNYVSVRDFSYCPSCAAPLGDTVERELDVGTMDPEHRTETEGDDGQ
jgi:predicted amidophosphoribosyltransferase